MIDFENESDYELFSLAKAAVLNRISLRSSGTVPNNDLHDLYVFLRALDELNREQLIAVIKEQDDIYHRENGTKKAIHE